MTIRRGTYIGMRGDKNIRVHIVRRNRATVKVRTWTPDGLTDPWDAHPEHVVDGWNHNPVVQR